MTTFAIAFFSALLVGAVLTRGIRDLAISRGWLDVAQSSRKIHTKPIPRLGGVAIVFGFFAPLAGLLVVNSDVGANFQGDPKLVYGMLGGGLVIALLGLYDDFHGARARHKFLVQFAVALAICASGLRVESISNPLGADLELGLLAWPFTVLWIVGVINALNLIDGLDGLAGGVAFFVTATSFILAVSRGDVLMALFMAALAGALLGFLLFNFNPASIFMGDTGSMFLGFVLAVASLRTSSKSDTAVSMLVPIIALGLPIMDTLLAMGRRMLSGRPMFSADKEHIHHRLMLRLRFSHRRTVLALYGFCCFLAAIALGLSFSNGAQSALLLVVLVGVSGALLRKLGFLERKALEQMVQMRRRNQQLRSQVDRAAAHISKASSLEDLWASLRPLAETLNVSQLVLRMSPTVGMRNELVFHGRQVVMGVLITRATVPVQWDGVPLGTLVADWRDGRSEVHRDEELGLERVAEVMARAIARLRLSDMPLANATLSELAPSSLRAPGRTATRSARA